MVEGNEAVALGCHYGGVGLLSWYPITPSSSLAEGICYIPELRADENGDTTVRSYKLRMNWPQPDGCGGGWSGVRAMTQQGGRDLLMSEFIGSLTLLKFRRHLGCQPNGAFNWFPLELNKGLDHVVRSQPW
ncbi:MAG: hypothetical protein Ct9H90mP16_19000 [Candidatus Poseidoniales archaeon]|nr:MAG: hypothetical protein Ct9H90mP16_19000 [Candidatus Poseidoniales archaeon]